MRTKRILCYIIFLALTVSTVAGQDNFYQRLADSTLVLTKQEVQYNPRYFRIPYPNGDVPANKGVCTDVIIGIVVNKKSADGKQYLIVHNIGRGQVLEDCLFRFTIIGHYQYKK